MTPWFSYLFHCSAKSPPQKVLKTQTLLLKTQEKLKIFRTAMQETYRFLSVAFHFLEEASQLSEDIFQFVA